MKCISCNWSSLHYSPSGNPRSSHISADCSPQEYRSGHIRPGWSGRDCRCSWAASCTWSWFSGRPRCPEVSWGCLHWEVGPLQPSQRRGQDSKVFFPSQQLQLACEFLNFFQELSFCLIHQSLLIQSKIKIRSMFVFLHFNCLERQKRNKWKMKAIKKQIAFSK